MVLGLVVLFLLINSVCVFSPRRDGQAKTIDVEGVVTRKLFIKGGKLFFYRLPAKHCSIKHPLQFDKWLYFDAKIATLVGIPPYKRTRRTIELQCADSLVRHTLVVKPMPFKRNFLLIVYTKNALSLKRVVNIVQLIESFSHDYVALDKFSNAGKNADKKRHSYRRAFFVNLSYRQIHRLIKAMIKFNFVEGVHIYPKHVAVKTRNLSLYKQRAMNNETFSLPVVMHGGEVSRAKRSDVLYRKQTKEIFEIVHAYPVFYGTNHKRQRKRRDISFFGSLLGFGSEPRSDCLTNTPPLARQSVVTLAVNMNKFDYVVFDKNLFMDTLDGDLSKLSIAFNWANGKSVLNTDWIQFNTKAKCISTFATFETYERQPGEGYKFLAVVTDRCNASTTSTIFVKVNKAESTPLCDEIVVLLENGKATERPPINATVEILNHVAEYDSFSYLEELSVKRFSTATDKSKQMFSFVFTLSPSACENCEERLESIANHIKSEMADFEANFRPDYKHLSVYLSKCGTNTPPMILYPLQAFKLSSSRVTKYKITSYFVFDIEDGFLDKLTVEVVNSNYPNTLLITASQLLFAFQLNARQEDDETFQTKLIISDTAKAQTTTQFELIPSNELEPVNHWFKMTCTAFYSETNSRASILSKLLNVLASVFNVDKNDLDEFVVMELTTKGVFPLTIDFHFTTRTLLKIVPGELDTFTNKLADSEGKATSYLSAAVLPYLRNVRITLYRVPGKEVAYMPPIVEMPRVVKPLQNLVIDTLSFFDYVIPRDTHLDVNDGDTRALKLTLLKTDGVEIPRDFWLRFDKQRQAVIGRLPVDALGIQNEKQFEFKLVAKNSLEQCSNTTFSVKATRSFVPSGWIEVQMNAKHFMSSTHNADNLKQFLDKYNALTDSNIKDRIEVKNYGGKLHSLNLAIIHSLVENDSCDVARINLLKSKLLIGNEINPAVASHFLPQFVVIQLSMQAYGECVPKQPTVYVPPSPLPIQRAQTMPAYQYTSTTRALPTRRNADGPRVNKLVPRIYVSFCKSMYYYVQPDTFIDDEDGDGRQLGIQLLHNNGSQVNPSSWIQWSQQLQCVYGLLKLTDYDRLAGHTTAQYLLQATNSDGHSASTELQLVFPISRLDHHYTVTSTLDVADYMAPLYMDEQINIWRKLSNALNSRKIQIVQYQKLSASRVQVKWFVCGLEQTNCPAEKIREIEKKITSGGNQPSLAFKSAMTPEYSVVSMEFVYKNTCPIVITNTIVTTPAPSKSTTTKATPTTTKETSTTTTASTTTSTTTTTEVTTTLKPTVHNFGPVVLKLVPVLKLKPCQEFSLQLPEDTFFDFEDGLSRNLNIYLQSDSSQSPLLFDRSTLSITAESPPDDTENSYELVAIDQKGLSVKQKLSLEIDQSTSDSHYRFTLNGMVVGTESNVRRFVGETVNKLFSTNTNIAVTVKSTIIYTNIQVVIKTCALACSFAEYTRVRSVLLSNNILRADVVAMFLPHVTLQSFSFALSEQCKSLIGSNDAMIMSVPTYPQPAVASRAHRHISNTTPNLNKPMPLLTAAQCRSFRFEIPEETFYDSEDGYTSNLKITLLKVDASALPENSWIRLEDSTLKGVYNPSDEVKPNSGGIISYLLVARDSHGAKVHHQLNIQTESSEPNHLITFHSYVNIDEPRDKIQTKMLVKIIQYAGDIQPDAIRIVSFTKMQTTHPQIVLKWYSCSVVDPCSLAGERFKTSYFDGINLNTSFTLQMMPEFVMIGGVFNSTCSTQTTTLPPITDNPPYVMQPLQDLHVPICSTFSLRIPSGTFYDREDGGTRMLKLTLLTDTYVPIGKSLWLQFIESTQVVYGYVRVNQLGEKESKVKFWVKATDSNGRNVYTGLTLILPARPQLKFTVQMTLTSPYDFNTNDLNTQIFLASQISLHLGGVAVTQILILDFNAYGGTKVQLTWSNCTFLKQDECNKPTRNFLQKLLLNQNNQLKPNQEFLSRLKPYYQIDSIVITNSCKDVVTTATTTTTTTTLSTTATSTKKPNKPPQITRYIPPVTIQMCHPLSYRIPEDIFEDEDGTTSSLKLELLLLSNQPVGKDSWVILKPYQPIVSGMLSHLQAENQQNGFRYFVRATDSQGLFTNVLLPFDKVLLQNKRAYQLHISFTAYQQQPISQVFIQFARKMGGYLGQQNDLYPLSFNVNIYVISTYLLKTSFCSMNFDITCPRDKINAINARIFDNSGRFRQSFMIAMAPEFSLIEVKAVYDDVCSKPINTTPSTTTTLTPSVSPEVLPSLTYLVSSCQAAKFPIPTSYFPSDVSSLTLTYRNNSAVSCRHSWINVNIGTRVIYGIAHVENMYRLLFRYKNNRRPAIADVTLNHDQLNTETYFKISMTFRTTYNASVCHATLFEIFKSKLSIYFREDGFTILESISVYLRPYLQIGFCSQSLTCDYQRIDRVKARLFNSDASLKPDFLYSMSPDFYDFSVFSEYTGACSRNQSLTWKVQIPTKVCVGKCGVFSYSLPENILNNDMANYEIQYLLGVSYANQSNISSSAWIKYADGTFYGAPSMQIAKRKTPLEFVINAYSYNGVQLSTWIEFEICGEYDEPEQAIFVSLTCTQKVGYERFAGVLQQLSMIYLDGQLSTILLLGYNQSAFNIDVKFSSCDNRRLLNKDIRGTSLKGCLVVKSMLINGKDYPPFANIPEIRLSVSQCGVHHHKLPRTTFVDVEDGDITNLELYLTYPNDTRLSNDHWITVHDESISVVLVKGLGNKGDSLPFKLKAVDSKGQIGSIPIYVEISNVENSNFNFFVELEYKPFTNLPVVLQINALFTKLDRFMNRKFAQQYSVEYIKTYGSKRVSLSFADCTLSRSHCEQEKIDVIVGKLTTDSGNINPAFVTFMFPECYIENVNTRMEGVCKIKNTKPILVNPIPDQMIHSSGYLEYHIPSNTFYDKEDGWNLTLSLDTPDQCWIAVEGYTLFAYLSEDAIDMYPSMSFRMNLTATDSSGSGSVSTTIRFILKQPLRANFQVSVLFQLLRKPQPPCVLQNILILQEMQKYTGTQLSLKRADHGADETLVEATFVNSSMRHDPCDYISMDRFVSMLEKRPGTVLPEFIDSMMPKYNPRYISVHTESACRIDANQAPIQNDVISFVDVETITCYNRQLEKNLATDAEDGDLYNLKATLFNATTGFQIRDSRWIYFNDSTKTLAFVGSMNIALSQPLQGYKFFLQVLDSRMSKVAVKFIIKFKILGRKKSFIVSEVSKVKSEKFHPVLSFVDWKQSQEQFLGVKIEILNYNYKIIAEGQIACNITWQVYQKTDNCNFDALSKIQYLYTQTIHVQEFYITKYGKCLTNPALPPIAKTAELKVVLDPCAIVNFTIPHGLFLDNKDGATRNLSVSATLVHPQDANVGILYHATTQSFFGNVFFDLFEKYEHLKFTIKATNSAKLSAYTNITFSVTTHPKNDVMLLGRFFFYSNIIAETDINFLSTFREKFSAFVEESIWVYRYNVTTDPIYEYNLEFGICAHYNCSKRFDKDQLLIETGVPTPKFIDSMLKTIVPREVYVTQKSLSCNTSPRVNIVIEKIDISICGNDTRYYDIPYDAFIDSEDGMTRSLSISARHDNLDWLFFDTSLQRLYYLPTMREFQHQFFIVEFIATDSGGLSISQNLTLQLSECKPNYVLQVYLLNRNLLAAHYTVLENLYQSLSLVQANRRLGIYNMTSHSGFLSIDVISCDEDTSCNPKANRLLFETFSNENGQPTSKVKSEFNDYFIAINVTAYTMNNCSERPYITENIPELRIEYNTTFEYFIPDRLFTDAKDGVLPKSSISMFALDGKIPPLDSPVQYDQNKARIYGLLTLEQRHSQYADNISVLLRAFDTDNHKVDAPVLIRTPPDNAIYAFSATTTLYSYYETYTPDVDLLLSYIRTLYKCYGDESKDTVGVVSFKRLGRFRPQTVQVHWFNVTASTCREFSEIYRKLNTSECIPHLSKRFVRRNISFHGGCKVENQPPKALKNVSIVLQSQTYFRQALGSHIFEDKEDGTNLRYKLLTENDTLIDKDFSVQLNDQMQLFGYPLSNHRNDLKLQATDSQGLYTTTHVEIIVNNTDDTKRFFLNVSAVCVENELLTVEVVRNVTAELSSILSVPKDEIYVYEYTFDRMRLNVVQTIPVAYDVEDAIRFYNLVVDACIVESVSLMNETKKPAPNTSPVIFNTISSLNVQCGVPLSYEIPQDTFYDEQEGFTSNLTLRLLNESIQITNDSRFLALSNQTLNVFINVNDCLHSSQVVRVGIRASDSEGLFANDMFNLLIEDAEPNCCGAILIKFNESIDSKTIQDVHTKLSQVIYKSDDIRFVSINNSELIFENKSLTNSTCGREKITNFTLKILTKDGTLQPDFKDAFPDVLNATLLSCNSTTLLPITVAPPVANAGAFITSEEWFFYVLPLFILAFMLLVTSFCFYVCKLCFAKCRRRPSKVLVESVSDVGDQAYARINEVDETSVRGVDVSQMESAPGQRWDVPDTAPEDAIIPTVVQDDEKELSFHTSLLSPEVMPKKRQKVFEEANDFDPTSALYAKPQRKNKKVFQVGQPMRNSAVRRKKELPYTVPTRGPLRLPAIPDGPPPPYSPPRRQRVFSKKVIPSYYERYTQRKASDSPFLIPVREAVFRPTDGGNNNLLKPRKLQLPSIKRLKKKKRYRPLVVEVPAENSPRTSEDSVEMRPISKVKMPTYKRRSQYLDAVESNLPTTSYRDLTNGTRKSRRLTSYDYLPVRKTTRKKYRLEDPDEMFREYNNNNNDPAGGDRLRKSPYVQKSRRSRYLDSLREFVKEPHRQRTATENNNPKSTTRKRLDELLEDTF